MVAEKILILRHNLLSFTYNSNLLLPLPPLMKTYPIFLASSFELKPEREKFENFINRQNKRLVKKNVFLKLEIWEDLDDALNSSRKQEDYNEALACCEICIVLFWTKMGRYTLEEFELAYQHFLKNKKPRIYVYERQKNLSLNHQRGIQQVKASL